MLNLRHGDHAKVALAILDGSHTFTSLKSEQYVTRQEAMSDPTVRAIVQRVEQFQRAKWSKVGDSSQKR